MAGFSEDIVVAIFVGVEGVHAYSAFLPSVFTIKTFVKTEYGKAQIREGEIMASIYLAAMVAVTAKVTKSVWPLVFGAIAGGVMVAVYEYALSRAPVSTGMDTDADFSQPDNTPARESRSTQHNGWYRIES